MLDTNVLVSALLSSKSVDSAPVEVVEQALAGRIIPLYSQGIIDEYHDVLLRKKFSFDPGEVSVLIGELQKRGQPLEPVPCSEYFPDPDDAVFYTTMLAKSSDSQCYLVTGNRKHYPENPSVLSPRQMIDLLRSLPDPGPQTLGSGPTGITHTKESATENVSLAQEKSMRSVWDNPEDEIWNDTPTC